MKHLSKFLPVFFLLFTPFGSYAQSLADGDTLKMDYAFLRYDASMDRFHKSSDKQSLKVFYVDGTSENLKQLLNLKTTFDPVEDNFSTICKAFFYLNSKGYKLASFAISDFETSDDKPLDPVKGYSSIVIHRREYVFIRNK